MPRLRVHVIDAISREPIPDAEIYINTYTTRTDVRGVAELDVPAGTYDIVVRHRKYFVYRDTITVTRDMEITVELEPVFKILNIMDKIFENVAKQVATQHTLPLPENRKAQVRTLSGRDRAKLRRELVKKLLEAWERGNGGRIY